MLALPQQSVSLPSAAGQRKKKKEKEKKNRKKPENKLNMPFSMSDATTYNMCAQICNPLLRQFWHQSKRLFVAHTRI